MCTVNSLVEIFFSRKSYLILDQSAAYTRVVGSGSGSWQYTRTATDQRKHAVWGFLPNQSSARRPRPTPIRRHRPPPAMARRGKLLPQLLVALAAASHLLAASAAPPSRDAVAMAVPPGAAPSSAAVFRGARRLGQHHLFPNSTGDADTEIPASSAEAPTSSFDFVVGAGPEAPIPLPSEEADADADVEDPASVAAAGDGQDRPSPFRHASKTEVIIIVCFFAALIAAVELVLLVRSVIQKARDEAVRPARVHPLDEDAAGVP